MAALEAKFCGMLSGYVALVTGASRGIGKGIAKMLCEAGATVYITGRRMEGGDFPLCDAAQDIENRGGNCVPVECDHSNDQDVEKLFTKIEKEQDGRLDILVNNAFAGVNFIMKQMGKKFYEQPIEAWDIINNVGTRSNYIAAHHAANMMVKRNSGLIVNISSPGGLRYLFNLAYGVGKEANDRMAVDMAIELRKKNVCVVSMWPGAVITELVDEQINNGTKLSTAFSNPQDSTLTGKVIVGLASDKNKMSKSGKVVIVAELANEYGLKDVGDSTPLSVRQLKYLTGMYYPGYEWLVPSFLYVPKWLFSFGGHKL
ncbi:dehydrogenase/reductase SDR family member 1-like [Rhopilema esculentum]|uniref:dehydrogenase/reductase SDR family member 1-like n=1 Tax=Rhopilema esculentum TaxID=499914 RepID=UPI0031D75B96|eukprot:gene1543-15992_t